MIFDPTKGDMQLIQADARHLPIEDESVQCIVTSPPYWGLRKYAGEQESIWGTPHPDRPNHPDDCSVFSGKLINSPIDGWHHVWGESISVNATNHTDTARWNHTRNGRDELQPPEKRVAWRRTEVIQGKFCQKCGAWRGAYGLEPTIELYISHTVEILREMRRVLRADGVLFWNIGDSYNSSPNQRKSGDGDCLGYKQATNIGSRTVGSRSAPNLKPKDLCLIPARVAIAAQQDGWWIRSLIIWAKPNPMPESCTDRPTDAYEHILMLTKSERYFWDAYAVREPAATGWNGSPKGTHSRGRGDGGPKARARADEGVHKDWAESTRDVLGYRNIRNVWMFPTQPFSGAHFATFPEEIPHQCILAATSVRGACTQCGAPWERVTRDPATSGKSWNDNALKSQGINRNQNSDFGGTNFYENYQPGDTIGWRPTCECRGQHGKTRPCLVLDPFAGSGTTGRVARALRRHAVLADVAYGEKDEYRKLALARLRNVDVELPFLD